MSEASGISRVDVPLDGGRSYPILIGDGLIGQSGLLEEFLGPRALIVTNAAVAKLLLPKLRRSLGAAPADVVQIGDGERFKTLATFSEVIDQLIAQGHNRDTTVVALGGGVVGDVAGFAAATYQRGVDLVQVPTTLLAQVDSAVGGKTAVNHPGGKNLIGAFHQPRAVVADVAVLRTLPPREFAAGLAEVVKYGVIADADFFAWLEDNAAALLAQAPSALRHAVCRACQIKAEVVAGDERETGRRAILNFGHTFGHALEAATGYQRFLHGEAVAIGMTMAMALSVHLGRADPGEAARVGQLLTALGLPTLAEGLEAAPLRRTMGMDKKVRAGQLRFIVCDGLGTCSVAAEAPESAVEKAISARIRVPSVGKGGTA